MAVHNLLDMTIRFFIWYSEYGDPIFCLVLEIKVDLVIYFFFWLEGVEWMSGYNHPYIKDGEYTPFKFIKTTKISITTNKRILKEI